MFSLMLFAAGLAIAAGAMWEKLFQAATTHGSAHWLKISSAARAGLFGRKGVPLGDWGWPYLPVSFAGDGHILTVAPPGAGKSSTASIPGGLSDGIASRFVADPDGEITSVCIGQWRKRCEAVYVINPFGLWVKAPWDLPRHAFDPMVFINPQRDGSGKFARLMASALIAQGAGDDGSTEYFKSQGGEKLEAYLIYGALHGMTLPQVADLMALPIDAVGGGSGVRCQYDLWERMKEIDLLDGLLRKEALDLQDKLKNSPGEFQAIFSTMKDGVKFLKEPAIRRALEKDEVDWFALKERRAVISIVMPVSDWKLYSGFVKLAFMCVMLALDEGKISPQHVHILLEEFPALGRLPFFGELLATGRKKKAKIEIVIQNIGQIKSAYPEWQALIPNFEVRRFKAVRDGETAKYVSGLLGNKTERVGAAWIARELMTPDEVMTMAKDRQIVFAGNLRPGLLGQYPYWKKWGERRRALQNPFYGAYPDGAAFGLVRRLAGLPLYLWQWIVRPSPYMVILGLSLMIWSGDPAIRVKQQVIKEGYLIRCSWLRQRGSFEILAGARGCSRLMLFGETIL